MVPAVAPNGDGAPSPATPKSGARALSGTVRRIGRAVRGVGDDEELGRFDGRRVAAVRAGLDAGRSSRPEAVRGRAAAAAHEGCSSRSRGRRVGDRAGLRADLGALVVDTPAPASNVGVLVVLHREVGVERGQREPPARPQRPGHARPRTAASSPSAVISPNAPGTGRSRRRTPASNAQRPGVERARTWRRARARSPRAARSTNRWLMSTPCTSIPRRASRGRGGPGRTRRRAPGHPAASPSASTRRSTSCSVPLVNEYRR